ncbi:MAG TPA: c-type cytochrome domain-containing protein [Arenibacter sp.]|nr:c-type cytochrome domain-containing protein [Arenibacter sp.]
MEIIQQLLGRLHPLVVHLPIGFIITALLLQGYDRKRNLLTAVIAMIYLWGFIAATFACISGYLLYLGEGYSFDTVKYHLWTGVVTALISLLMYLRLLEPDKFKFIQRLPPVLFSFALLFLISATGHLGGNITHGSDYLLEPLPQGLKTAFGIGKEPDKMPILEEETWDKAILYTDLVQPILDNRCISCHNPKKDKGELQLQDRASILRGGESGETMVPNDPENSPLFSRLVLPVDHEDHMPPKDKVQLSQAEIAVIKAWIAKGGHFDATIADLGLEKALFASFFPKAPDNPYPDVKVAAIPADTLTALKRKGFHIEPVAKNSNFIRVSCINKPSFADTDMDLLRSVAQQIVYLDLGGTRVTDALFDKLRALPNLTVLKLDNTAITGAHMEHLQALEHLQTLNLASSQFSQEHFPLILALNSLKQAYLFNTPTEPSEAGTEKINGGPDIDYGHYELPIIATDTIVY